MNAGDRVIRWAAAVSVVVVAAIAAVISYGHAHELAVTYGESGATAKALPLTVDGLIVTCSLVLLDSARRGLRAPRLAWFLLSLGVVATLGANVAHGLAHGVVGAVIAGWPAVVAVGSFEMLARLVRGNHHTDDTRLVVVEEQLDDDAQPEADLGARDDDETLAALVATARDQYAQTPATGGLPSVRAIRRDLHLGHPRAVAVRATLASRDHRRSVRVAVPVATS